ncbi:MAG: PorV/PorQ family protein [Elusimicrobia bacterium]|nr:PorV/PorQ family protein [Elusimicrobiota bacterium]
MKRLARLIFCISCACHPGAASAGSAGREPFDFLFLDANARAVAMGGAYTALANDANALHYNPAGLGRIQRHEFTAMRNQYAAGISQDYLGLALRQGVGLSANHLSYGDIPRTTISNPDGSGSFGARDLALGIGYGRSIRPDLGLGAAFKLIREAIDDVSASAYATDVGLLYTPPALRALAFGFAIQNMGPTVTFRQARENLPLNVRLGAAYRLGRIATLSLDLSKERSESVSFAAGAEAMVGNRMALRAGFNGRNDAGSGLAMGLGWIFNGGFEVGYAFVLLGELGSAHRISLTIPWGESVEFPKIEEDEHEEREKPAGAALPVGLPPASPETRFQKAEQAIARNDLDLAKKELQEAVIRIPARDPRWIRYFERLGHVFFLEGACADVKAACAQAIRLASEIGASDEHVARAYRGMGLCLFREGNRSHAERSLRKALEVTKSEETRRLIREDLSNLQPKP